MLEPIDIDINMNQNVSEEAGKAAAANEEMTKSVDTMQKEIERLNKVVQDMSTALAEQKKLTADNAGEFDNTTKKIETMQAALDKAEQELAVYQATCEQMNKAVQNGADVTDVLADAKEALFDTEEALVNNAKELIDNQEEINQTLGDAGKSTDTYSTSNQILSAAIKEVCNGLGIENTQVVNAIGNVRVIQAAKTGWANAVKILNTQLGLSIAQSKMLLGLGLATGIGAIVAVVSVLVKAYQDWKTEQEEIIRLKQEEKKFYREVNASIQEQIIKVSTLDKILRDNNLSYKERNSALNELKAIMPEYNAQLSKEGTLIEDNTGALKKYIRELKNSALAKISVEKLAKAQDEYDEWLDNLSDVDKKILELNPDDFSKVRFRVAGDWEKLVKKQNEYLTKIAKWEAKASQYTVDNLKDAKEGTKEYWEQQKKNAELRLAAMKDQEEGSKKWNEALSQYRQADKKLKTWDIKGSDRADAKAETAAQRKAKKLKADGEKLEKMSYDLQKRIDNASVKAIGEGAERERQAAKAEYDQTKAFLEQKYKEVDELEKKTGKPATEQRTLLLSLDVEATRQYEAEIGRINAQSKATIDTIFTEVNARFASELDQNITSITQYYAELIKEATKAGATIEEVNRLKEARDKDIDRAGVTDKLRKADLAEALEMEKANNLASIGLTTIAEQTKFEITKKYLKQRIDLLRKLGDESSNKEADILEERLKGMQSSPKSVTGLINGALFDKIKKGFEKTGISAEEAKEKTTSLFSSFQKGGAQAMSIVNDVKSVLGGLDEGLDKALDAVGNIAQGFASGGIVGGSMAVIGEGIKLFTSAAQVEKEHQQALKQLALAKLEMQREYNLLLLKEQLIYKQGSNIFGADQIRGAANSILTYRDSIAQLKKEMQGEKPNEALVAVYEKMANSKNGLMASVGKKKLDEYKKQLDAYNKGIGALADVDIVTGSRKSGWGFWKKRKDVYSSLLETYDDVIDSEGKLNTARIQAILNTHKMSDENRALLESLLSLDEAAKEAEEQLKSYLTQTFGGLGDALADSIVTAFHRGEDAAQLFKGNVTDVLNDIAKQMVFGLYLKDTFDKLEKDIEQAYTDLADDKLTEEQLSKKITDILGGFFGGLDGDIEKANQFLEEFWRNAEANGFDRPESERQGATGGFATASQDSINELTGGVYAVRQIIGDIRNDSREELLIQRTIMGQLSVLVERSEYWEYLKELPSVVQKLEDIETYGLKMKV